MELPAKDGQRVNVAPCTAGVETRQRIVVMDANLVLALALHLVARPLQALLLLLTTQSLVPLRSLDNPVCLRCMLVYFPTGVWSSWTRSRIILSSSSEMANTHIRQSMTQ